MKWTGRNRMFIVAVLFVSMLLCGCTTLLNGDLTVEYLTEEERAEIEALSGVGAVLNYQDSILGPQAYESEYPDAFYIPEKYSKEPQDIKGFELLDFVNGDTFIYAYQTMVYQDTGTAPSLTPVSGDYVYCENSVTEDTRKLSGQMVTVLAANRYTAHNPGEGYRVIRSWVTDATDQQSFFAAPVGEWVNGAQGRKTQVGSYAVYFNGHAVVYRAAELQGALKNGKNPEPLIDYNFSGVIQDITQDIMKDQGIDAKNRMQYQFDIHNVSFSAGEDYVDVYMTVTQSKIAEDSVLEEESARVDQITDHPEATGEEETVDESQYQMKSYDVRMGFYAMERSIVCNIQNINCGSQIDCFRRNGSNMPLDYEWNVSDNSVSFLTKEDVLRRFPSDYKGFFLEGDAAAISFVENEATQINETCSSHQFKIEGFTITGQLRMTSQSSISAVRQGYYMVSDNRVESDTEASFVSSRTFTLEKPMVLSYQWNSQKLQGDRQYSKYFVTGDMLIYYASYIPEGDSDDRLGRLGIDRSGEIYAGNSWNYFIRRFMFMRYWDSRYSVKNVPAIDSVTGKASDGKLYIFCHTQDGIYLYPVQPAVIGGVSDYVIGSPFLLDYEKLNASTELKQNRDDGYFENSRMPSGNYAEKEYEANDATPDVYPDYSINDISGLWTENQRHERIWTLCTASSGLEIIKENGEPFIPVFQKNVIYEDDTVSENDAVSYYQQLTRLEEGVAAYAVFENQGDDKDSYPFLLLGYDYQGGVYTAMDIARAKVIPFAIVEPGRSGGGTADEAWGRVTAEPGESRVYYLKDCYDRSLYGTVRGVTGYHT